jgi:hypothetical protein
MLNVWSVNDNASIAMKNTTNINTSLEYIFFTNAKHNIGNPYFFSVL